MALIRKLLAAFIIFSFPAACFDDAPKSDLECKDISEEKGSRLAREKLYEHIEEIKNGRYRGVLESDGVTINKQRIQSIEVSHLNYSGIWTGGVDDGVIYKYNINNIDEFTFYVHLYSSCAYDVRLKLN